MPSSADDEYASLFETPEIPEPDSSSDSDESSKSVDWGEEESSGEDEDAVDDDAVDNTVVLDSSDDGRHAPPFPPPRDCDSCCLAGVGGWGCLLDGQSLCLLVPCSCILIRVCAVIMTTTTSRAPSS